MSQERKGSVKDKFDSEEYPIHLIGRHLDITEAMQSYAVDKLKKVKRFGCRLIEASIVMDIQRFVHSVDFILDVNNTKIKVSGKSTDMYASIDLAIGRLEAKLRKYHKRLSMHHATGNKSLKVHVVQGAPLEEINDQIEEATLRAHEEELIPHAVISQETMHLKTLTQEEAVMKMELSSDPCLIYVGEDDRKMKVIYRREDGNYGIIAAE